MTRTSTTPVCFWCRSPKPMSVQMSVRSLSVPPGEFSMLDYDPCDHCLDTIHLERHGSGSRGIWVIEVLYQPNIIPNQPPIGEGQPLYPTGRWAVIEQPAAMAMGFFPAEAIVQKRCLMSPQGYNEMLNFGKSKPAQILNLSKL